MHEQEWHTQALEIVDKLDIKGEIVFSQDGPATIAFDENYDSEKLIDFAEMLASNVTKNIVLTNQKAIALYTINNGEHVDYKDLFHNYSNTDLQFFDIYSQSLENIKRFENTR